MFNKQIITASLFVSSLALPVFSAPLDLSNQPLSVGFEPAPNVMMLIDDSGSMGWGTIDETSTNDGQIRVAGCSFSHALPFTRTGSTTRAPIPVDSTDTIGVWRARSWRSNRIYYNPELTYTPWTGVDDNDAPFAAASPAAARLDAYDPDEGTVDLTGTVTFNPSCDYDIEGDLTFNIARYHVWNPETDDANANGRPDNTENHVLVEIAGHGPFVAEAGVDRTGRWDCAPLPLAGEVYPDPPNPTNACTEAQEMQNFANWFTYYRTRMMTTKAAYSQAINETDKTAYIGIIALHDNSDDSRTEVKDIGVAANKASLIQSIVTMEASSGTPLRDRMYETCRYLACDNNEYDLPRPTHISSGGYCPRLPLSQGGACQKNYLIAMTDGYYNGTFDRVGNTDQNGPGPWDGAEYGDSESNSLADIAMRYFETDIHGGSYVNIVNDVLNDNTVASHQHITTYAVAFGVTGGLTSAQIDDLEKLTPKMPDSGTTNPWPTDIRNNGDDISLASRIDDLRHAAFNGRGEFLSAADPSELKAALKQILEQITQPTGSGAGVNASRSSIISGGYTYQAVGDPNDWSGDLLARPISTGKSVTEGNHSNCVVGGTPLLIGEPCAPVWRAAEVIDTQDWDTGRQIFTRSTDLGLLPTGLPASGDAVPFRWDSVSEIQQLALRYNSFATTLNNETIGQARTNFIRGSREYDGPARPRKTALGDILGSGAVFVSKPAYFYDIQGYDSFKNTTHLNRPGVVYVGANDGMLHAFNASDGTELFGYIPGDRFIWANLNRLASKQYKGQNHRYFVDGQPTYVDVQTGGSASDGELTGASWKSVLAGGLGNGGQSVYLLDITDPAGFDVTTDAENTLLWEFSDLDDPDLGFTHSTPSISRMANGRWAVIIGNGYNNSESDLNYLPSYMTNSASTTGQAYLFILYVDGPGSDGQWDMGTDYFKIPVAGGTVATPNGMATPIAVDVNADMRVDYIYAGDQLGQVWRFDVTSDTDSDWVNASNTFKLFAAENDAGDIQPITVRPEVVSHPYGVDKGLIVLFGTGRYLDKSVDIDNTNYPDQSFYGIWDRLDGTPTPYVMPTRSSGLVEQEILMEVQYDGTSNLDLSGNTEACDTTQECFRIITENVVTFDPAGTTRGWYLDLYNTGVTPKNNRGERNITNPLIRGSRVVFTTLLPKDATSPCNSGGDGWLMELDVYSGGHPSSPVFDANNDGVVNKADKLKVTLADGSTIYISPPGGMKFDYDNGTLPAPSIIVDPISNTEKKCFPRKNGMMTCVLEAGPIEGRLSWREIY